MKKLLAILLLAGVTMLSHAGEPDFSFPVSFKGCRPTIADFVAAIAAQEDPGEWMAGIGRELEKHRRGGKTKGRFLVDSSKGCMTYVKQSREGGVAHEAKAEFRCWRCSDGYRMMVAEADNFYQDGVVYYGQYTGVSLYLYDDTGRRMKMVYGSDYGFEAPETNALFVYSLTDSGIVGIADRPEGGKCRVEYEWNGAKFVKSEY